MVTATRIAGGIGIVACAAVIALAAGGGSVFGGLGGLFGARGSSLQVAKDDAPAADIVASPTAAEQVAALRARIAPTRTLVILRSHRRAATHRERSAPRPVNPGAPLAPAPSPAPGPTPTPVPQPAPAPSPGGGQVVTTVGNTVRQVTNALPPQTQPLTQPVNDAVDTLEQVCQGLPVCP